MARPLNRDDMPALVMAAVDFLHNKLGYPPSLREVATHLGVSAQAVLYHLQKLRSQGLMTWIPRKSRTLMALKKPPRTFKGGRYAVHEL